LKPSLILVAFSLFTWGIGEGMFFIFQPIYLQQLGADPLAIGAILGLAGLAMTAAHVPAGFLADRFGRRPLLISAWVLGALAAWMMALANTLPSFVAGLLLYGLTAFVAAPLSSYATAARGTWPVGRALTFISATFNAGSIAGPFLGGWIGDLYGLKTVYVLAAVIFIFSTVIIFFLRPQPVDAHDPAAPPVSLRTNRRYIGFLVLFFVVMFALYLPQPLSPKFLEDVRGLSLSQIGLLGTAGAFGNALLTVLLGLLNVRLGFVLAQLGVGFFAFLIWREGALPFYALGYFTLGGYRAAKPLASAQIRPLIHEAQMGLAYGIAETVNGLTIMLAPPLAGLIYTRDPGLVYPLSIAAITTTILLTLSFAPRKSLSQARNVPSLE
jgi:MFS family permease